MRQQEIIKCRKNRNSGISIWNLNKRIKRYCKNCPIEIKKLCSKKH